jgi:hypothetical protein
MSWARLDGIPHTAAAVALTSRTAPIVDLLIRGRRPVAGIPRRAVGRPGEGLTAASPVPGRSTAARATATRRPGDDCDRVMPRSLDAFVSDTRRSERRVWNIATVGYLRLWPGGDPDPCYL